MKIYNTISTKGAGCIILLSIMILSFAQKAQAQQKIDPTVEVEKEFDGKVTNIVKSPLNTALPDSLLSFNLNFNYSIFDKPYKDLYEFTPLPSAKLQGAVQEKYPVFMAKAGIGFPLAPVAEVFLQPKLGHGSRLAIKAFFDGYYGKKNIMATNVGSNTAMKMKDAKVAAPNHTFGAGADYGYSWRNGFFTLGVDYSNNFYTYYGFADDQWQKVSVSGAAVDDGGYMKENFSHTYDQIEARMSIGSIKSYNRSAKFNYLANINFKNTSDKISDLRLNENLLCINGNISPAFNRFSRFVLGINSENMFRNIKPDAKTSYGIFDVTPTFTWDKERWKLEIGIKLSGKYKSGENGENADEYHHYVFAVADFSYNAIKEKLWIYANIDGKNIMNSYSSILDENKWISPYADLRNSSMPFILNAGVKGKFINRLGYDAYVRYALHKGMLQYAYLPWYDNNVEHNALSAVYGNTREFTVGAAINWKSKEFEAGANAEYSNYTDCKKSTLVFKHKPLGYAPFRLNIYGTYNYIERFYAGVSIGYRSKCESFFGDTISSDLNDWTGCTTSYMKSYLNLSVNARYAVNRIFSVFINGDNLLNAQIQHLPNYLENGINFTAGVLVKF